MMIIPAIDLRDGRCVRLTQGRRDSTTVYEIDPVSVARRFQSEGAEMLHVVDLDAAFGESSFENYRTIRELICAVDIPVQVGGGMRATSDVVRLLESGASRVIVGTVAVSDPDTFEEMIGVARERVVVGIDANCGQVMTHGWEQSGQLKAVDLARRVAKLGVKRVVYTDVQRDGMFTGPNIEQAGLIAGAGVTVTISGGISSLQDLREISGLKGSGIDSVIVGKALYEGRFTLAQALEALA